jgi:hypothetical protein
MNMHTREVVKASHAVTGCFCLLLLALLVWRLAGDGFNRGCLFGAPDFDKGAPALDSFSEPSVGLAILKQKPTLRGGQRVALNKLAYLFGRPQRGEIVGVWTGSGLMVKRVLGLPGETIALRDGMFYVNGAPVAEPYVQFHDVSTIAPGQLSPDCFVVAGNNRSKTIIAVANRDRIVGRLVRKPHAAQLAVVLKNP